MLMLTFRLSRNRMMVGAATLVLVAGLWIAGNNMLRGGERMASVAPTGETTLQKEKTKLKKVTAKTNEERIVFIKTFGWEVSPEPVEVLEVIIPKEFDGVYRDYNALQKKQGYDLENYAGKRCKRYSYQIINYPGAEGEVHINLLFYGNRMIGGDICSTEANGFMHGFEVQ